MFAIYSHVSLLSSPPIWAIHNDDQEKDTRWAFSGVVGIFNAQPGIPRGDIGIFLWEFARGTGISDRATSLLMLWAMNGQIEPRFGRLKYATDQLNISSRGLARRLGFRESDEQVRTGETNDGEIYFAYGNL